MYLVHSTSYETDRQITCLKKLKLKNLRSVSRSRKFEKILHW